MDEATAPHHNGNVSAQDETKHRSSVSETHASLTQSENDIGTGRTDGGADARANVADIRATRKHDHAADFGEVANAMASTNQEAIDSWRAETDYWETAELGAAEADYAFGDAVRGEDLRHRNG